MADTRLTNSIDRSVEAFKILRELRPYLTNARAHDEAYGQLLLRIDRLIAADTRGSDGNVT